MQLFYAVAGLPYIQFFTGDWLKDPTLTICTPATRGVWIDLLCAMHECGRSGELCGTRDQLARLARCSTSELNAALAEIQTLNVAELQDRNGRVTVINRRMKREAIERNKSRLRMQRHRRSENVTPHSRDRYGPSSDPEPDPEEAERESSARGEAERPAWSEVKMHSERIGLAEWKARDWFDEMEGCGWLDHHHRPVQLWQSILSRVRTKWEADGRPSGPPSKSHSKAAGSNGAEVVLRSKELERVEKQIMDIRNSVDGHRELDFMDKENLRRLKARRTELKNLLGIKV